LRSNITADAYSDPKATQLRIRKIQTSALTKKEKNRR
jgi:hypothetical protein